MEIEYRSQIPDLILDRGFKNIAEIGVAFGGFANLILSKCNDSIDNYYAIDPWCAAPEARRNSFEIAQMRIGRWSKCRMIKKLSIDASNDIEDGSIDLVYIDGAHDYDSVYQDLSVWYRKLRKGGILSGHDYPQLSGVKQAVDAFAINNNLIFTVTKVQYNDVHDHLFGGEEARNSSYIFEAKK